MKKGVMILGLLISFMLIANLVSAQSTGTNKMIQGVGDLIKSIYNTGIEPLARFLIGSNAPDADVFFALILFLVLLVSILWEISGKVPFLNQNQWVQFIVSFVIGLISIRFLAAGENSAWFQVILLPNQALGIALLCLIPLVIYFFFVMDVRKESPTLAKIMWVFAAVLFAVLYFVRADEMNTFAEANTFNPLNIYLIAAVLCIALLLFDGTIGKWWDKIRSEKAGMDVKLFEAAEIREKKRKAMQAFTADGEGYSAQTQAGSGKAKARQRLHADLEYYDKQIAEIMSAG